MKSLKKKSSARSKKIDSDWWGRKLEVKQLDDDKNKWMNFR